MAWVNIPNSDIDPDSPITTSLMTAYRDNFQGLANGDADAPSIQTAAYAASSVDQTAIGSAAVGQGELKTTRGAVSASGSDVNANFVAPGGQYGFWPSVSTSSTGAGRTVELHVTKAVDVVDATYIHMITTGAPDAYGVIYQRYIQASPPYNLGDGDIPLFIFATVDNLTGEVEYMYISPEAPWHYNGKTDIRATRKDKASGRSWRKCCRIQYERLIGTFTGNLLEAPNLTDQEKLDIINDKKEYEIEITQAIKQRDMPDIPHPFIACDLTGKTVVMFDPVSPITEKLLYLHNAGENINELIHRKYINYGNTQIKRVTPDGTVCVDISWKNTGA